MIIPDRINDPVLIGHIQVWVHWQAQDALWQGFGDGQAAGRKGVFFVSDLLVQRFDVINH